jgi:hypothetical protein
MMKCIDFSNAFVQAQLTSPVDSSAERRLLGYIWDKHSREMSQTEKKSLYGLSVMPKLWYLHLHEQLETQGFKPGKIDPCLYFCHGVAMSST